MDEVIIRVYGDLLQRRGCSVDEIACDPELRREYLSNSRAALGTDCEERTLLKRLFTLRKRSKLQRCRGADLAA